VLMGALLNITECDPNLGDRRNNLIVTVDRLPDGAMRQGRQAAPDESVERLRRRT